MYNNCTRLTTLDLSGWKMSSALYVNNMFRSCSNLETIYASDWISRSRYSISGQSNVFYGCSKLDGYSSSNVSGAYCKLISQGGYFSTK